jgi:hypothetical protein
MAVKQIGAVWSTEYVVQLYRRAVQLRPVGRTRAAGIGAGRKPNRAKQTPLRGPSALGGGRACHWASPAVAMLPGALFLLPLLPVPLLVLLTLSLSLLLHPSPSHLSSVISLPPFCSVYFVFLPSPLSLALHSFVFALTATPAFGSLIAFADFVFIHHEKKKSRFGSFRAAPRPVRRFAGSLPFCCLQRPSLERRDSYRFTVPFEAGASSPFRVTQVLPLVPAV